MKKKPTVVQYQQPKTSSVVDVLEQMLTSPATRNLLGESGTRVVTSVNPTTGKTVFSFRAADYPDDEQFNG